MNERRLAKSSMVVAAVSFFALTMGVVAGCDRDEFDPEAAAEGQQGPVDRSDQYTTRVEGATIAVGEESEVDFLVLPGPDLKINDEFGWSVQFEDTEGLDVATSRLGPADIDLRDERATIPVSVTAESAGEYRLEGEANFSVCNDERCDILRAEPVELILEAE